MALGVCKQCGQLIGIRPGRPVEFGARQLEWTLEYHEYPEGSAGVVRIATRCPGSGSVIGSRHG